MALREIVIDSVLGGVNPTQLFGVPGGYSGSIAIDPDFPLGDSGSGALKAIRTSGVIRPVAYEAFDGSNVTGNVLAIITNPKDSKVYAILANGRIVSYNSSLASETLEATCAGNVASGAAYYNNYIYVFGTGASANDVSRFGPLDGSPALTDGVWTGSTLGTQTALGVATYPSIRGSGNLPKHVGFAHVDGKLYFADFDGTTSTPATRGKGLIHFIKTKYGSAEGDTNDASTYNALDLPFGYRPTAISNFDSFLAVVAVQTTGTSLEQGKSAVFLWDTVNDTFVKIIPMPDVVATAILNVNGNLYVWGGKLTSVGGYSLYQYLGGQTMQEIVSFDEGHPPMAHAVDAFGDRILWGSWITYPENAAVVWAYGSKDARIPPALHCVARATAAASSTDGLVTAIRFAEQASNARPQLVIGWRDASNVGLDKLSTTYQTWYFHSEWIRIGRPFLVKSVRMPLTAAVGANMTITPKLYVDDGVDSESLSAVNNTNNSGARQVKKNAKIKGRHNLMLELKGTGTALLGVHLPIRILIDELENE